MNMKTVFEWQPWKSSNECLLAP